MEPSGTASSQPEGAALVSSRAGRCCSVRGVRLVARPARNFETCPARANRSVREFLNRPYGGEQVRGYLGHVVVGDLQDPEVATPGHERVANRPVLALRDERGRVDRLPCGELEQITALAADARNFNAPPIRLVRDVQTATRWPGRLSAELKTQESPRKGSVSSVSRASRWCFFCCFSSTTA